MEKEQQKLCLAYYEKWMFEEMYKQLTNSEDKKLSADLKDTNAILESFLLHTRNLMEFLRGTNGKSSDKKNCSDIVISDFVNKKGEKFEVIKANEWKIKKYHKDKIDKRLSHLSEGRLNIDKDWSKEIKIFKKEIKKHFNVFIENLSDEYFPLKCWHGYSLSKDNLRINLGNKHNNSVGGEKTVISNTSSEVS